jgi:serine/threonine protein kinase
MNTGSKFDYAFKAFKEKYKTEIAQIGKILGKGAFGEVRDVKYKNKAMAVKIMERDKEEKIEGEKLAINLRNYNIIKIQKIYEGEKFKNTSRDKSKDKANNSNSSDYYDFIIMEKAVLRDLGKLNEFYHRHNLLKLIKDDPDSYIFNENTGDSLLRFYAKQIINALEILDDNNYVHFDIKPENLLMSINLIVRLTDFSLLKEVKETYIDFKIPGGTQGYITPEYYIDKRVETETARKQDYFALGSSLFLLKYGLQLLKYKKYDEGRMNADRIVDLLQQNINYLKSQVFTDRDFIYFIISLINYTPEERAFFQQIIRNKWLNKNADELDRIVMAFENDEEKLIIELQKNDFFLQKEENLKKRKKKKFSKSNKYCFKKQNKNN